MINNLQFIDFPRQIPLETYQQASNAFVAYFRDHSSVKAIYEMGSIGDPGISDLDLILVLGENGRLNSNDFQFLSSLDNYVFAHNPFVVPETIFPYIQNLFFASNMRKLSGNTYAFHITSSNREQKQLGWIICAEAAVGRLLDLMYQLTFGQNISLRNMLLKLNSIKHNISLAEDIYGRNDNKLFDEFCSSITNLRKDWFYLGTADQLEKTSQLLSTGMELLSQIISRLAGFSKNLFDLTVYYNLNPETLCFIFPNSLQIAKFHKDKETSINRFKNPLSFIKKIKGPAAPRIVRHVNDISTITMPGELLCLFYPLLPSSSVTSKILKNCLFTPGRGESSGFSAERGWELFRKRQALLDEYIAFIQKKDLSAMSVMLIGPWYLGNKARFYNIKRMILKGMIRTGIL